MYSGGRSYALEIRQGNERPDGYNSGKKNTHSQKPETKELWTRNLIIKLVTPTTHIKWRAKSFEHESGTTHTAERKEII